MYTKYIHAGSTENKNNLSLGEKEHKQENTSKEDSEFGYSEFTVALTFHLPHPQKKDMQFSQMHKKIEIREW